MLVSRARTARADERATDTRSRIMDAPLPLAALTGLRKLSMDEVARYAKVGRATLYKYFPGRDALIAAFVQQELARFSPMSGTLSSATTIPTSGSFTALRMPTATCAITRHCPRSCG